MSYYKVTNRVGGTSVYFSQGNCITEWYGDGAKTAVRDYLNRNGLDRFDIYIKSPSEYLFESDDGWEKINKELL